jgi:hypothetical protein
MALGLILAVTTDADGSAEREVGEEFECLARFRPAMDFPRVAFEAEWAAGK